MPVPRYPVTPRDPPGPASDFVYRLARLVRRDFKGVRCPPARFTGLALYHLNFFLFSHYDPGSNPREGDDACSKSTVGWPRRTIG